MMLEYIPDLLVFQNENSQLVNSLPYIDEKVDDAMKDRVNALIRKEML